ncbi:hypothetical protein BGZ65_009051, partial [Modicella reniformis]
MKSTTGFGSTEPTWGPRARTVIFLGIIIFISGWSLLSNISRMDLDILHHDNEEHQQQQQKQQQQHDKPTTTTTTTSPLEPPVSLLDPNNKYLSYLPFAGITNQFIGLEAGLLAAKLLNRTLIIPPIISNTHDHDNTHQRWSRYFDIPRFINLTGVKVLEWDLVRPLTPAQRQIGRDQAALYSDGGSKDWSKVSEDITCHIVYGYGSPRVGINFSAKNFAFHFLFRLQMTPPLPSKPGMTNYDNVKLSQGQAVQEDLVAMEDLVQRYANHEDQLLLLSHTFKLRDPGHEGRYWTEIGANLHFIPQLMEYATQRKDDNRLVSNLDEDATESGELANPETSRITAPSTRIPHIAIHMRRGDIGSKCGKDNMKTCLVPFEYY